MEFIINTDLEKALPATIDFNFEEMKAKVAEKMVYYNALVVTEDAIDSGKADRARLNKLVTTIEDSRKEIKKQCLAPYEDFERKCKVLTGMVGQAITAIDTQVKAFENAEKDEKRKTLEHFYKTNIKSLIDLLPLEKIWSDKWLNKTVTITAAQKEMIEGINRVHNDVEIIRAMRLECETVVLDTYLRTLDMSAALVEKNRFEEQQKRLQELAAQKEVKIAPDIRVVPGHGIPTAEDAEQISDFMGHLPVQQETPQSAQSAKTEPDIRTIRAEFIDTTPEFRAEQNALIKKHNIICRRI